jgi:hypothetical protein
MPRYYFHLHNDLDVPDEEGSEHSNLEAARAYAAEQIRGVAGEMLKEAGRLLLSHFITIEDERGTVLDTVYFRDVLNIQD